MANKRRGREKTHPSISEDEWLAGPQTPGSKAEIVLNTMAGILSVPGRVVRTSQGNKNVK